MHILAFLFVEDCEDGICPEPMTQSKGSVLPSLHLLPGAGVTLGRDVSLLIPAIEVGGLGVPALPIIVRANPRGVHSSTASVDCVAACWDVNVR